MQLSEYVHILYRLNKKGKAAQDNPIWSVGDCLVTTNKEQFLIAKIGFHNLLPKPVKCRQLYEALKTCGEDAKITTEKEWLIVKGARSQTMISWLDTTLPEVPDFKNEPRIKYHLVREDLDYVLLANPLKPVTYQLTGIYFDGIHKRIVCSDGKRLNIRPFAAGNNFKPIIVPRNAGKLMSDILALDLKPTYIRYEAKPDPMMARFEFEDIFLVTLLIEGKFPDYRAVFPNMYHWTIRLDEDDLRTALKEAITYLMKETGYFVKFDMKKDHVEIIARHSSKGLKIWQIKAYPSSGDTDGFQWLCVNPHFLLESMYAKGVTHIQGSVGDSPILVDGTSLCMPLRPITNGIEGEWYEKTLAKYRQLEKTEKPLPFPTASIKNAIPQEKLEHTEVMGRCEICGCATPLGQTLCDKCRSIKQKVDMAEPSKEFTLRKAPLVSFSVRKKKRFKDIQFDPMNDMFV